MPIYRSFKAFINSVLVEQDYKTEASACWYKTMHGAKIVVTAQNKRFEFGVFIEYGLNYEPMDIPKRFKPSDCIIYGRNPAMNELEIKQHRELLKDVKSICRSAIVQVRLKSGIVKQLNCMESWADRNALIKRVYNRKPLMMIVNEVELGI